MSEKVFGYEESSVSEWEFDILKKIEELVTEQKYTYDDSTINEFPAFYTETFFKFVILQNCGKEN